MAPFFEEEPEPAGLPALQRWMKLRAVEITVLYFAAVRDLARTAREEMTLPSAVRSVAELQAHLERVRPELAGRLAQVRFARNEVFADASEALEPGDVVALIPPVAGG